MNFRKVQKKLSPSQLRKMIRSGKVDVKKILLKTDAKGFGVSTTN